MIQSLDLEQAFYIFFGPQMLDFPNFLETRETDLGDIRITDSGDTRIADQF